MKTKKIFLSILVVLFVFIAIMVPAGADGPADEDLPPVGEMVFETSTKTYHRGDRIEVTVSLQNVTDEKGILGVDIDSIKYDSAVLTFESVRAKSLPSEWTMSDGGLPIMIANDNTKNPVKSGLSVLLTFKVNENAEFETTTISASGGGTSATTWDSAGITFGEVSVSIVCDHKFDQKNTESKYMKSAATCKAKAVYYYSCSCGEKGTSTFEYGEYASHTYGSWISEVPATCTGTGTKGHYECSVCHKYFDAAKNEITDLTLSKLMHTYNQKKTDAMYMKSAATCKAKAVYYYSCSCGEKGTTTFEYGNLAAHTYKTAWATDAKNHWHECSVCGSKKDEAAHADANKDHKCDTCSKVLSECADTNKDHKCDTCGKVLTECADANKDHNCDVCGKKLTDHTGGKATCKEKATCSICGQKYGNLAAHTYKTTWSSDSANHWHECSVCGSKKDEAAHADANKDHKCDTCSKVLSECADTNKDHKCDTCGKVLTECADANKDHNCDVCGKKLTDHTGGKATCKEKATCSICGQKYGNLAAHTYKTTWSSDSANHWHECSVCGNKKDEAAHTPGAAATETTAQVCTVCNYVITPALGHTHSFTKRVDERYLKSKATCTAKAVYYYSCSCGAIGNSTFEYGELAEHTAMYFWSNDRTAHWHECSTCGKKLDLSVHIPNRASATETEPVVCTVCGYLIEAAHGHIHNITGYWEKDEENHWHSCTGCDLRFDLENHVFTLVADKRNAGSSVIFGHEECVTCGLKKGSLLYGIEPGTTVEKLKEALGKDIVVNGAKNGLIGTGTQVVVNGKKYTVIIKGDIDGDGKITATDYIRVRLHILKRIRLDGEKLLAAHTSTEISKNVSAADYIAIRLHILKKKLIVQ